MHVLLQEHVVVQPVRAGPVALVVQDVAALTEQPLHVHTGGGGRQELEGGGDEGGLDGVSSRGGLLRLPEGQAAHVLDGRLDVVVHHGGDGQVAEDRVGQQLLLALGPRKGDMRCDLRLKTGG